MVYQLLECPYKRRGEMNGLSELTQASIYEGKNEWFTRVIKSLHIRRWK